jgi:NRPS condensation-like uncharacterized protein
MTEAPGTLRIPVSSSDLILHHHSGMGDRLIQCVLEFPGRLDEEVLRRSAELLLRVQPVLGCRFVEDPEGSRWERPEDPAFPDLLSRTDSEDPEEALWTCAREPMDSLRAPQVRLCLIRSDGRDRLLVKFNHDCTDAGGVKACLRDLALLYGRLLEDPGHVPPLRDPEDRGLGQVLRRIDAPDLLRALEGNEPHPCPTWALPLWEGGFEEPYHRLVRIEGERFRVIREYRRSRGCTWNDLLLTAYYRALFELLRPEIGRPLTVGVTVDLRRYLPRDRSLGAANLSGGVTPALERVPGERFEGTLERVARSMAELKESGPGLRIALLFEIFGRMGPSGASALLGEAPGPGVPCPQFFSNVGRLGEEPEGLAFGPLRASGAYLIGPALCPPTTLLALSTYGESLALCAASWRPALPPARLGEFLDLMRSELHRIF